MTTLQDWFGKLASGTKLANLVIPPDPINDFQASVTWSVEQPLDDIIDDVVTFLKEERSSSDMNTLAALIICLLYLNREINISDVPSHLLEEITSPSDMSRVGILYHFTSYLYEQKSISPPPIHNVETLVGCYDQISKDPSDQSYVSFTRIALTLIVGTIVLKYIVWQFFTRRIHTERDVIVPKCKKVFKLMDVKNSDESFDKMYWPDKSKRPDLELFRDHLRIYIGIKDFVYGIPRETDLVVSQTVKRVVNYVLVSEIRRHIDPQEKERMDMISNLIKDIDLILDKEKQKVLLEERHA